jgi:tRNA uridine 5-carboxymethylaminomethyl modification enzyme
MFTSRAEYRLRLREDNADQRLTPTGRDLGLVGNVRWEAYRDKVRALEHTKALLARTRVHPGTAAAADFETLTGETLSRDATLSDLLKRPRVDGSALAGLLPADMAPAALEQAAIEIKYAGYIDRQEAEIERVRSSEAVLLPAELDYAGISGLSVELRNKLEAARPANIARAARIPGMTPAALSVLLVHAKRWRERA